jgi:hypothetical protein
MRAAICDVSFRTLQFAVAQPGPRAGRKAGPSGFFRESPLGEHCVLAIQLRLSALGYPSQLMSTLCPRRHHHRSAVADKRCSTRLVSKPLRNAGLFGLPATSLANQLTSSKKPLLKVDREIRQAILDTERVLKNERPASDALKDDLVLEYYDDGYPKLPACLDRRPKLGRVLINRVW